MKKHAFLIMSHGNFYVLEKLIRMLDDARNDIYLHIDKKIKEFDFEYYKGLVQKSGLFFLEQRLDVRWGDVSQIKLEFLLFKLAFSKGRYMYYHLLSGVDLPIKSQDEIHFFFEKHSGKEFVGFKEDHLFDKSRVTYIHLFPSRFKNANLKLRFIYSKMRGAFLRLQRFFHYRYLIEKDGFILKKGPNWVSVTGNFVEYLLPFEASCLKMYRWACCADEVFLQTILYNSPFREHIYAYEREQLQSCMRLVNWRKGTKNYLQGSPDDFKLEDRQMLLKSDRLFARKFSDRNKDIVDWVFETFKRV